MWKPAPMALIVSACLHGLAGYGLLTASVPEPRKTDETLSISYLRYEPERPQRVPMPRQPELSAPIKPRVSAPKKAATPKRQFAVEEAPMSLPAPPRPVSESRDVMRDPKRGKVFTSYFGTVKDRINRTVRRKYSGAALGTGSVTLMFILDRYGAVENAWVASSQSTAGPYAQEFALAALRAAGPFPPFPAELDLPRIAFTVTVLFEETGV